MVATRGCGQLVLVTAQGRYSMWCEEDIRPMGLGAKGVIWVALHEGDRVVGGPYLEGRE